MLSPDVLDEIWETGLTEKKVPTIPSIKYAVYYDKIYYVMEDHRSVYFLMSVETMSSRKDKNKYKAYAVVADKCKIFEGDLYNYYNIEEGGVKVVGCNKPFNSIQEYLIKAIQENST